MTRSSFNSTVVDQSGDVQSGASVHVTVTEGGADAEIYSVFTGGVPIANPIVTGADGFVQFYAEQGRYTVTASFGGNDIAWVVDLVPSDVGGGVMLAANNLSDVADVLTSTQNLSVEVGVDVQAHSSVLDATTASFTTADEAKLDAITGTNTGDQDLSGYQLEPAEGAFVDGDKTKLNGIATGATANDTDANLRDRTTHTGVQAISTVTGLQTALDGKAPSLGADDNYVTDAEKTVIGNTSGTNSGDQDISGIATNAGNIATNTAALGGLSFEVVAALPGTPDANTIYFVTA